MKMIKKIATLVIGTLAALSLTACSSTGQSSQSGSLQNSLSAGLIQNDNSSSNTSSLSSSSTSDAENSAVVSSDSSSSNASSQTTSSNLSGTQSSTVVSSDGVSDGESADEPIASEPSEIVSEPDSTSEPAPSESGKTLVAYFSWSGTSERIANNIISNTGADSYRIERETPYSDDYNTVAYGEAKDEADSNARPPLKNAIDTIDQYDTIVICYPIWWHTCPMTVGTFLNKFDFSGKTVVPVSQSASMDAGQYEESVQFIKDNAQNANVLSGVFSKNQSEIDDYLAQNGVR